MVFGITCVESWVILTESNREISVSLVDNESEHHVEEYLK
jgi:hypothetical protein